MGRVGGAVSEQSTPAEKTNRLLTTWQLCTEVLTVGWALPPRAVAQPRL